MDLCYCPCFGLFKRRRLKSDRNGGGHPYTESNVEHVSENMEASLKHHSSIPKEVSVYSNQAPTFTYNELAIATSNFSSECLIGRGGFGAVFKGKLKSTGQVVAVKQLDLSGFQGDKEFLVEVLMLSLLHHDNLVNLIGFCAEGEQRLLVYEYMPLGSLENHLFDLEPDVQPLDWNTRIKIAAGAARGLNILHSANPPVIHRDLKASNILLDENFHPKLSDFGLAKFGPSGDMSHVSTRVLGTYGYCAPEYASTGRLTMKTDIYSYGIILLELISGRKAVDVINGRQKHLVNWARPLMTERNVSKLVDPLLKGQYSYYVVKKALEVAMMCIHEDASLRPSSSDLLLAMDFLLSKQSKNVKTNETGQEIGLTTTEATIMSIKNLDRDHAVAEAKKWGENWRLKQQKSPETDSDNRNSWVDKVKCSH